MSYIRGWLVLFVIMAVVANFIFINPPYDPEDSKFVQRMNVMTKFNKGEDLTPAETKIYLAYIEERNEEIAHFCGHPVLNAIESVSAGTYNFVFQKFMN